MDGSRRSSRDVTAAVVMVLGIAAAAVVPLLLCVAGWHRAQIVRGDGAGRGVFTVAACGDRREHTTYDDSGSTTTVTYTCTGTFDGRSAPRLDAAVSTHSNYSAGVSKRAYITGDGKVYLASTLGAAGRMGAWFTAACLVGCVEGALLWRLRRRIRDSVPAGVKDAVDTEWWAMPLFAGIIGVTVLIPVLVISWLVASLLFLIVFAL